MPTVQAFLAECRSHVGTTENPPGSNKQPFAPIAGHPNGQPWCASYVVACSRRVGLTLPSESAYTPTMADGFRKVGAWYASGPKPGDLAFFDFPDSTFRIQHVGVVIELLSDWNTVRTVEGNTSSGNYGSQDNGGGVFERVRPLSYIKGFGRPSFVEGSAVVASDKESEMGAAFARSQGGWAVVEHDGGVFTYGGAPFLGSIPGNPNIKLGGNVVSGLWTPDGMGYWLFASDGAVYGFGDASYYGGFNALPATTRGGRYVIGAIPVGQGYGEVAKDSSGDTTPHDLYVFGPTSK